MIDLVWCTYLVKKIPLNAISNEKTLNLCNLEVAKNPFLFHPRGVDGLYSLSFGSLSPPK